MARCTLSGLIQVPAERGKVAEMTGCMTWQRRVWLELPSVLGMVGLGFNQTTMAVLNMVITASFIAGFDDVGWAKEIWDMGATPWAFDADWARSVLMPTRIFTINIDIDMHYRLDRSRYTMRYVYATK